MMNAVVRGILIDKVLEVTEGYEVQQLREYHPATIHNDASFAKVTGQDTAENVLEISNRRNLGTHRNSRHYQVCLR